ncbi:MAG TPA: hypothetical protein VGR54_01085 [Nitrosopumilaceae archaeon]|nr:hypothetical protein [Nitrosopumilaceae archaeon]
MESKDHSKARTVNQLQGKTRFCQTRDCFMDTKLSGYGLIKFTNKFKCQTNKISN